MNTFRQTYKRYAPRYLPFICLYSALAIGASLCEVLITRQTGAIGDAAIAFDIPAIVACLGAMGALTAVKMALAMASAAASGRYQGRVEHRARRAFAEHFARIPLRALQRQSSGDALSMYTNDLPSATALVGRDFFVLLSELALLLTAGGFMFFIHPLFTLIFFALFPPLSFLQVAISKPIQPLVARAAKLRGEYNAVVADSLQNTAAVLCYSLQDRMRRRYRDSYDRYFKAQMKRIALFSTLIISGLIASFTPWAFLSIAAALAVVSGDLSIGAFIALNALGGQASQFLSMLSQRINALRVNSAGAQRIAQGLAQPHEKLDGEAAPADARDAIVFEEVSFAYGDGPDAPPVLDGVSLSIRAGSRVAIVGASGSGKSTAAKLMQALYEPTKGAVRILGMDVASTPKDAIRSRIACVAQDPFLLPESIRDNIACGDGPIDEARLEKACRDAGIWGFICAQPGGLDFPLSEGGDNLSGGQRQRLAIARALYRDAPILLLDEATSALDPATEGAVLHSLNRATQGRTVVVVAHRLAAIADCERILVMQDGRLIEDGPFDRLMAGPTAFASLYARQAQQGGQVNEQ